VIRLATRTNPPLPLGVAAYQVPASVANIAMAALATLLPPAPAAYHAAFHNPNLSINKNPLLFNMTIHSSFLIRKLDGIPLKRSH